jgi:hypothetical protein
MSHVIVEDETGAGVRMVDIVAVAKGLIDAGDLKPGGELTPQMASRVIASLFSDPFLAKITTERMSRLKKQIDVVDMMRRRLVRVPQGSEPTASQLTGADEGGCTLEAGDVQLFATLTLDFLREHANDPQLTQTVERGFTTVIQRDLVDLGFNGVSDDGAGGTREAKFVRLHKGWLQIMREAASSTKLEIDPATDGWIDTLRAVKDASDPWVRPQCVFLMNNGDADAYARELNQPITGQALNADSPLRRAEGHAIEAHPSMPAGSVVFTPLANLVHGVQTRVERNREYQARKRCLEYTWDFAVDYEVAVKKFATLGETA